MSSRKSTRLRQLSEALSRHKTLHIRDAAGMLDVSEMTIRRDIRDHPGQFSYLGGHIIAAGSDSPRAPYELLNASRQNAAAKRTVCTHALDELRDGMAIFVDCGTTLAHLVEMLPRGIDLTLVSYALNIADLAVRHPQVKLVLLGGTYHAPTAAFHPIGEQPALEEIALHTAFLSAAGLDAQAGATCTTYPEAAVKRAAMARARRKLLVMDESKRGQVHPARFAGAGDFDLILTENGPLTRP